MDQVRDQFLADNPTATHLAGGRDKFTGSNMPETYLSPNTQLASSKVGGSYTDMTFDVNGETVYVQTVDKGNMHGMSQREWDNANRILRQEPDATVITVGKGTQINPGDWDVGNMNSGSIYRF
ncbi:hypothetical protein [Pedobacter alluvionis]|uniref:Uncharacterized protein n=2 Tax=Pedobacter alluvionis TaxID=475253 RepID=A0A497XRC8_9SPHI|nr:hypothetical protein [Pedobacter alluvionis]RLJ69181.1 hypothetical protein BCL90_5275 [Pedobacter alluvionis]